MDNQQGNYHMKPKFVKFTALDGGGTQNTIILNVDAIQSVDRMLSKAYVSLGSSLYNVSTFEAIRLSKELERLGFITFASVHPEHGTSTITINPGTIVALDKNLSRGIVVMTTGAYPVSPSEAIRLTGVLEAPELDTRTQTEGNG